MHFVAIKMGGRQGGVGEASPLCFFPRVQSEDASPTAHGRRPIFIATECMLFRGQETKFKKRPLSMNSRCPEPKGLRPQSVERGTQPRPTSDHCVPQTFYVVGNCADQQNPFRRSRHAGA